MSQIFSHKQNLYRHLKVITKPEKFQAVLKIQILYLMRLHILFMQQQKEMQSGSAEGMATSESTVQHRSRGSFHGNSSGVRRAPHPLNPSVSQFRLQCIRSWNGEPAWALKSATFSTHSL